MPQIPIIIIIPIIKAMEEWFLLFMGMFGNQKMLGIMPTRIVRKKIKTSITITI